MSPSAEIKKPRSLLFPVLLKWLSGEKEAARLFWLRTETIL
jgi:hypothetical protein